MLIWKLLANRLLVPDYVTRHFFISFFNISVFWWAVTSVSGAQMKLPFMVKTESPAVTQTVWFGGSWEMNRSRPSGYHKACCFGTAIGGNNDQISQICAITVQTTFRLHTNELLTQNHTFLIRRFSAPCLHVLWTCFLSQNVIIIHGIPYCPRDDRILSSLQITSLSIFTCWTLISLQASHISEVSEELPGFRGLYCGSAWIKCNVALWIA